jgi:uncharacterized protein (TIGR04222 family)
VRVVLAADRVPTWGIPGEAFLAGWVLVVLVIGVVAVRTFRVRAEGRPLHGVPPVYELACLCGGRSHAVAASIVALHSGGTIAAAEHGKVKVIAPASEVLDPLDQAVLHAIGDLGTRVRDIPSNPAVRRQLEAIEGNLIAKGQLPTAAEQTLYRWSANVLWLMVFVALVRFGFDTANGEDRGPFLDGSNILLLLTFPVIGFNAWLMDISQTVPPGRAPRLTREGKKTVAAALGRNRTLNPSMSPSWKTYGARKAVLGVALFGGPALAGIDPAFVAASDVISQLGLSTGTFIRSSTSSSSSSGGGSSCSGGSGGCSASCGSSCGGGCGE